MRVQITGDRHASLTGVCVLREGRRRDCFGVECRVCGQKGSARHHRAGGKGKGGYIRSRGGLKTLFT